MFLDDELLEMCRVADCSTPDNIQQLNIDLCKKCEDYYKSKIKPGMTNKEVKIILDKTFNLWDSFTRMAIKEDGALALLGVLFKKYSFKEQFLSNDEVARIYKNL